MSVPLHFHEYLSLKCGIYEENGIIDDTCEEHGNYIEYLLFDQMLRQVLMYIDYFNFLEISYFLSTL